MREDIERLQAMEREITEIARRIERMIPAEPDRYDLMLEAWNRLGGIGAELTRTIRALTRAIRKELGQ